MKDKRNPKQNNTKKAAERQSPKRVSIKAVKRRRMIKRILGLIMVFAVIGGAFYASAKLLFIVKTVNVNGSEIFTPQEITDFLAIPMEESIFSVKTEQLEQNLLEEFTYIEEAQIVKRFPDIIEITLTDSIESFCVETEDGYNVYSQNFKYLRNSDMPLAHAIWLEMDMENKELLDQTRNMLDLFEKYNLDKITKISLADTDVIKVEYDNRLSIDFGTMLDIDYKIKMCKKIIDEKIPAGEKGTIDATNSGEVVYTRQ